MGIQSTTGLFSGIDYGSLVEQLIELSSGRRDKLKTRNETLAAEQTALTELSALLLSTQYITDNLGKEDLYDTVAATSSNTSVLTAKVTGDPPKGSYQFTAVRTVQTQQFLSSGVKSTTTALGEGTMSFRFGDNVERSTSLDTLNGGEGIERGSIRITDRSGASTQIDLSTVQTIDDVLEAINSNSTINVTAVAQGDHIQLVDNTGQTVSNLKVQEVGRGTTAASLGLASIDEADAVADGEDLVRLSEDVELDTLNDGNGVVMDTVLSDISYQLRDGTTGTIDLSEIVSGSSDVNAEVTLGDVLDKINAASPEKLRVEISSDGNRLVVTDLTEGTGEFMLESLNDSETLAGLGLDGTAVDGVITGRRLLGGLKTVLLSSLNGGEGVGTLGTVELTDRSGASDTVDLSGAETLQDVVDRLNAADVGITAQINAAQNGIELVDTTGASASNLIVASADATDTAGNLGIAIDAASTEVNSGDLHLKVVSRNTLLADYNGGDGVAKGKITITDSTGSKSTIDLSKSSIETMGDVLDAVNRSGLKVRAELNDTGDGIRIRDTGGGTGTLTVAEAGSTKTAADLHILGTAKEVEIDGAATRVIDGSTTYTITLDDDDTLEDLKAKINELDAGLSASIFIDGSSKPYRLSLSSEMSGELGAMVIDTSRMGFSLEETVEARDALLVYGQLSSGGSNILISSSSNTFTDVVSGLSLTIQQASTSPVTVTIDSSDSSLVTNVETLVTNYNKFREKLNDYTTFDTETEEAAVLTGDSSALRLDTDLSDLLSGRFYGVGSIKSLGEVGITFNDDGTIELDKDKLKERYAADPDAVKAFFTTEDTGFSARFNKLSEQLAGTENSLLMNRLESLDETITENEEYIEFLNDRLDAEEERLMAQFTAMEQAIGEMQSSLDVINSLTKWTFATNNNDDN